MKSTASQNQNSARGIIIALALDDRQEAGG